LLATTHWLIDGHVCSSSRFSCEGTVATIAMASGNAERTKNQGYDAIDAADTWRRLWPLGQRGSQKRSLDH
jgi:hypothetical protein